MLAQLFTFLSYSMRRPTLSRHMFVFGTTKLHTTHNEIFGGVFFFHPNLDQQLRSSSQVVDCKFSDHQTCSFGHQSGASLNLFSHINHVQMCNNSLLLWLLCNRKHPLFGPTSPRRGVDPAVLAMRTVICVLCGQCWVKTSTSMLW